MQCGKGIFLKEINPITENCGSGMHVSGGGLAFLIYLAVVAVLIIFFFNREDAPSGPEPHEAIVSRFSWIGSSNGFWSNFRQIDKLKSGKKFRYYF